MSELGYAMLHNGFPIAEIRTRKSFAQARYAREGYNASQYATIDFPGLLSIETALEKSLASVPAALAHAGLLKQSEREQSVCRDDEIGVFCAAGGISLREGSKDAGRVSGGEPVLLEAQVRAERGMVELRRRRNARISARSPSLGGIRKRGSGASAGVVMGYRGLFQRRLKLFREERLRNGSVHTRCSGPSSPIRS